MNHARNAFEYVPRTAGPAGRLLLKALAAGARGTVQAMLEHAEETCRNKGIPPLAGNEITSFWFPSSASGLRPGECSSRGIMLVDFKIAERNLELPACIAATAVLRVILPGSAAFLRTGGLEKALRDNMADLDVLARSTCMAGMIACILCLNRRRTS